MVQMTTGVLGELADAADGYDHQAPGRQRAVRERSQVEFDSHRVVVALDPGEQHQGRHNVTAILTFPGAVPEPINPSGGP